MAQAADFVIVSDPWVVEGVQDTINFTVPADIDGKSSSIIGFMLEVDCSAPPEMCASCSCLTSWSGCESS